MSVEIQIAQSKECRAVVEMKFPKETYKQDFKAAMKSAIDEARKRIINK